MVAELMDGGATVIGDEVVGGKVMVVGFVGVLIDIGVGS